MAQAGPESVPVSVMIFHSGGHRWRARLDQPLDIAIGLDFDGPQPNHFDAPRASSVPLKAGDFIGDTRLGGSCNARCLHLTPHCNGTHTECIGHVTDDHPGIGDVAPPAFMLAGLVTITPEPAVQSSDTTSPASGPKDRVITQAALSRGLSSIGNSDIEAIVVRTLPNGREKRFRNYGKSGMPPYFSLEAIAHLVALGVRHLLSDTPSVDRVHDEGRMAGHRLFWGLPATSRHVDDASRPEATVTEMVYVPDEITDGVYLLNLQVPPFLSDAAPSRPVLYRTELS